MVRTGKGFGYGLCRGFAAIRHASELSVVIGAPPELPLADSEVDELSLGGLAAGAAHLFAVRMEGAKAAAKAMGEWVGAAMAGGADGLCHN